MSGKKDPLLSTRERGEGLCRTSRPLSSLVQVSGYDASSSCTLHRPYLSPLVAPSGRQKKKYGVEQEKRNKRKVAHGTASSEFLFLCRHFQYLAAVAKTKPQKQTTYPRTIKSPSLRYVYSSSDSSSSSTVVLAIRSKSRWPLWVMRRPPLSSSISRTPIFSRAWRALRSTEPEASTWWAGREPRFLVEPWALRRRPTPTVLRM